MPGNRHRCGRTEGRRSKSRARSERAAGRQAVSEARGRRPWTSAPSCWRGTRVRVRAQREHLGSAQTSTEGAQHVAVCSTPASNSVLSVSESNEGTSGERRGENQMVQNTGGRAQHARGKRSIHVESPAGCVLKKGPTQLFHLDFAMVVREGRRRLLDKQFPAFAPDKLAHRADLVAPPAQAVLQPADLVTVQDARLDPRNARDRTRLVDRPADQVEPVRTKQLRSQYLLPPCSRQSSQLGKM